MPKNIFAASIVVLVVAVYLSLGLLRLGQYSAVDEPYWTYDRTPQFWQSIAAHKWRSTNINDKPGITVALLSGFGLLEIDPLPYKSLRDDPKTDEQLAQINRINFLFRLPIFVFTALALFGFYFLLLNLFDRITAIFGIIIIGYSPILLGISLIINPDSLLWVFLPLSLLAYFAFQKKQERLFLFASGVLLGLSLLTKYVANILYIFYFLLPFLEYLFIEKRPELRSYLKKSLQEYLILITLSMATFFVLFPATWIHPSLLLKGTFLSKAFETTWPLFLGVFGLIATDFAVFGTRFTRYTLDFFSTFRVMILKSVITVFLLLIIGTLINTLIGMRPFDLESIIISPKGIGNGSLLWGTTGALLANTYSLIFGLPPLVFLAVLWALGASLFFKINLSRETRIIFYLTTFILLYYVASTANNVIATVRYQIALYPLIAVIAAIGAASFGRWLTNHLPRITIHWSIISVLIILFISLIAARPFYFTYASALLPRTYLLNFKDMGDGSYEVAEYLNALPDAKALSIWSDKGAVCAVFKGECTIGFNPKSISAKHFDYFVLSSGRQSRTTKLSNGVNQYYDFRRAYTLDDTVYTTMFDGRPDNFVKIIDAREIEK